MLTCQLSQEYPTALEVHDRKCSSRLLLLYVSAPQRASQAAVPGGLLVQALSASDCWSPDIL